MSEEGIRQVLARHGCRLRFREHDWVECLIVSADGVVRGDGLEREAALEGALRQLFPSRIARELFDVAVAGAERSGVGVHVVAAGGGPVAVEMPAAGAPTRVDRGPVRMSIPAEDKTNEVERPAVPRMGLESPARPALPVAASVSELRGSSDRARSIDAIDILVQRIDDCRAELAWSTAQRQRLAILAWICEARSHTDVHPEDAEIRDAVAKVSRQLTEIGKAYWPGSVTALQLQMQPGDLPRHLLGGTPSTWARAAELAERALQQLEHDDERRGHDAYGWADADALAPRASDPAAILDELVEAVEFSWGPLDRYAEPRNPEELPNPTRYRAWVRKLRWIRGQGVDPDVWARVMGRLRWWACRRNGPVQDEGRELEASFKPPEPWAQLVGLPNEGPPAPEIPESWLEAARARAADKKILCVGSRYETAEQRSLGSYLPDAQLEWRLIESELLAEMVRLLNEGRHELLLGAVGLQNSLVDRALARAARAAGVEYVRVNRGRAVSAVRALAHLPEPPGVA